MEERTNEKRLAKMAMMARAHKMIEQLKKKPEIKYIFVHGGLADKPRHEADWSSDLDLTVVTDSGYLSWHNFKHYQWLGDHWLEVDLYHFDINDTTPWDLTTREGYKYSCSIAFDKDGGAQEWLDSHTELYPELRDKAISNLMAKAQMCLESAKESEQIDKRMMLTKAVQLLVEAIFFINWEYPPDLKWRVSGHNVLNWKPQNFVTVLGDCNKTSKKCDQIEEVEKLFSLVTKRIEEEGLQIATVKPAGIPSDFTNKIARLFTRIDKYSCHSVRKCVKRGFPWNAHDLVSVGVENAIDIIYYLNGEVPPAKDKFAKLSTLAWQPKSYRQYAYQATFVSNYENADEALERAKALRHLFNSIKAKIEEKKLFETCSLYADNFMEEDLFCEDSPYMMVYKDGSYLNRSQKEETFAEAICKKLSMLSSYERNIVFGMCNHYLLENEQEFLELKESELEEPYVPVWRKAVAELTKKEEI